jgi:hypothetical protein
VCYESISGAEPAAVLDGHLTTRAISQRPINFAAIGISYAVGRTGWLGFILARNISRWLRLSGLAS